MLNFQGIDRYRHWKPSWAFKTKFSLKFHSVNTCRSNVLIAGTMWEFPKLFMDWTDNDYLGVSKNRGTPKWMAKIMENPIKMDDLGVPLFLETLICIQNNLGTSWDPKLILLIEFLSSTLTTPSHNFCPGTKAPEKPSERFAMQTLRWQTKRWWTKPPKQT